MYSNKIAAKYMHDLKYKDFPLVLVYYSLFWHWVAQLDTLLKPREPSANTRIKAGVNVNRNEIRSTIKRELLG